MNTKGEAPCEHWRRNTALKTEDRWKTYTRIVWCSDCGQNISVEDNDMAKWGKIACDSRPDVPTYTNELLRRVYNELKYFVDYYPTRPTTLDLLNEVRKEIEK